MFRTALLVVALLVGTTTSQLLDVASIHRGAKALFWGTLRPNNKMSIDVPIKGCLKQGGTATLKGKPEWLVVGQVYLVGGGKAGAAATPTITVNKNTRSVTDLSIEDKRFLVTQTDHCKPRKRCAGKVATNCKKAQICGNKAKFSQKCKAAATCQVNMCDCTPIFKDASKKTVCEDEVCSNGLKKMTCASNPCDGWQAQNPCAEATQCVVDRCGGCSAVLTNDLGVAVCEAKASNFNCRDVSKFNFGKRNAPKSKVFGFANLNGQCKQVKGLFSGSVNFFANKKLCMDTCRCQDHTHVDLGKCDKVLGFGVLDGKCQQIKGCPALKKSVRIALFPNRKACADACPAQEEEAAAAPIIINININNNNAPAPVAAPAAVDNPVASGRCPGGLGALQCEDQCADAPVPTCPESRNKPLVCVTDSCGSCSAKWLLNGKPFSCPADQSCRAGTVGCCPFTNQKQLSCSQYQCNAADCKDAVRCEMDPCNNCAPVFFDSNNRPISNALCRFAELPSAQTCRPGDADCCDSGFQPVQCPLTTMSECPPLKCQGAVPAKCKSDGCNKCALQIFDINGKQIDKDKCEYLPTFDICSKVQCPADNGEPDCGPVPEACSGVAVQCVKYPCTCTWNWVITDIRFNPQQVGPWNGCSAALQESTPCVTPDKCPKQFACEEPDAELVSQVDPLILKQLVCVQQPCTCQPILQPPKDNFRMPCEGQADCCPDGLESLECPYEQASWTCSKVSCGDRQARNCVADGCNQCALKIFDAEEVQIPHQQCSVRLDEEIASMCSKVVCPTDPASMTCPPRPACYPEDWKLDCIVDPCSCRAIWIDQDVRSKIECADQLRPACVEPQDCPKEYQCQDLDPEIMANLGSDVLKTLICVQEPCTCRPIFTTPDLLPAGFRLPCLEGACCADGQGPAVCNPSHASQTCARAECSGSAVGKCVADGCNQCNVAILDAAGRQLPSGQCRLPLDISGICPNVECPRLDTPITCGPKPAACGDDWNLRCIRDPCVCNRFIWVDEDIRFASTECTEALVPPCVPASQCPSSGWACPNGIPQEFCMQEPCTCRPVPTPNFNMQQLPYTDAGQAGR
mmetsp:Transcript_20443/g.28749  ORF Transcript_20443/g.28749 Transcript_20443/m.28749 type:complete len:1085 (+) Transcript_20443:25-3279(+)|eukprot:CAMPEP_0175097142 /NCGR_PEP_ID=MMETSP0086_2-20121207/5120_1 /TAXON_ID=136419 /ORGANISM="Unknown Unknown, Strain D1" /LENGTH=1084 /DNA_ID=CAMNT_0016370615 /DNA_START=25 /DNA_END=3279 /DNA_ORIENTATION=+